MHDANFIYICDKCHSHAFYLYKKLTTGDVFNIENIRLLDGSRPRAGNLMRCGSCGQPPGCTGHQVQRLEVRLVQLWEADIQ